MEGRGPAAVGDDELKGGKVFKNVGRHELHKGRGVAIDVVRGHRIEMRVARAADVDHGGHI